MFRIFILISLFVFYSSQLTAQRKNKTDELEKYFSEASKGDSYYISQEALKEYNAEKLLKYATPFLKDEKTFVRYKAIDLIKRKGLMVPDTMKRRQYTKVLVAACKDKDSGNSGVASSSLTLFMRNDFDKEAKDSVLALLQQKPYNFERIMQIAGFLEIDEARQLFLNNIAQGTVYNAREQWAAHLALARMGDSASIEYCLSRVKQVPVNDNAIYNLFPALIYTRQPQILSYLLQGILDDTKNCTSPNPNNEKPIICAFKIIELVCPFIENFPLQTDTSGEIDISNYDEALIMVRNWIRSEPELKIRREEF